MKLNRPDGNGKIDIRRIRKLLRRYVTTWRKRGAERGWPAEPIDGGVRSPAELVKKFRRDCEYRTHRQRKWQRKMDEAGRHMRSMAKIRLNSNY